MKIQVSRIMHHNENRLRLEFQYDKLIIESVKQIEGVKWSSSTKSWHIPETESALSQLLLCIGAEKLSFAQQDIISTKNDQLKIKDEKTSNKNVEITVINRKIRIKIPKNETDIHFIRSLRYSRWLKNDYCWEVPDYPGNIDLVSDYFKDRIKEFVKHDSITINNSTENKRNIGRNEVLFFKTVSGSVKIFCGFNKELIHAIKQMPYNRWDAKNKWWSIPFSDQFIDTLSQVCEKEHLKLIIEEEPQHENRLKRISALDIPNYRHAPESYRNKLIELRSSPHTIKNYIAAFEEFINYFPRVEIDNITEPQILEFIRFLITERKLSVSYQNVSINAIKFYYEKVLKTQRKFYYLDRPSRDKVLPEVLNISEITAIIKAVENIKHKLIIMFGYSSGLRLNEINKIKLSDIDRERMQLRVENGKGRKDRYTKISAKILPILDQYILEYQPTDLLFFGAGGSVYSGRSIQQIVKDAAHKAGIQKNTTPKTLRHTFATHSLENGVDLRYIQSMMGHASSKTTEIYTHITTKGFENIKSPMDNLDI